MMKKIIIALMAVAAFALAGFADVQTASGPYFGAEQDFYGPLDVYVGYEWRGDVSTFGVEWTFGDVIDAVESNHTPDLGIGISYEADWDSADIDLDFDVFYDVLDVVYEAGLSGRLDIVLLPSPCSEPDPCLNPEVVFFVDGDFDFLLDYNGRHYIPDLTIGGSVGFKVAF